MGESIRIKSLLNKKEVKRFALEIASKRSHKFTRVSGDFLVSMEAQVRMAITNKVEYAPSKGKTL